MGWVETLWGCHRDFDFSDVWTLNHFNIVEKSAVNDLGFSGVKSFKASNVSLFRCHV